MPWSSSDASAKTRKANTPAKKHQWAKVADTVLAKTGNDASAIKIANAAVAKHPSKSTHWTGR